MTNEQVIKYIKKQEYSIQSIIQSDIKLFTPQIQTFIAYNADKIAQISRLLELSVTTSLKLIPLLQWSLFLEEQYVSKEMIKDQSVKQLANKLDEYRYSDSNDFHFIKNLPQQFKDVYLNSKPYQRLQILGKTKENILKVLKVIPSFIQRIKQPTLQMQMIALQGFNEKGYSVERAFQNLKYNQPEDKKFDKQIFYYLVDNFKNTRGLGEIYAVASYEYGNNFYMQLKDIFNTKSES